MKLTDRQAIRSWENFHKAFIAAATINELESTAEQAARMKKLESDPESWFRFYFPAYCSSKPAAFHIKATRRIIDNPRWYEVRAWSRELAKSTRTMFEVVYLALTGKVKNILLISNSETNAIRLITPYKVNLESNRRIINDYGNQVNFGKWEAGEFITARGVSFRAIGAGQSPRGSKNEQVRPDVILIDDIDTDEECRNQARIAEKWKWIEGALIPTISVSGNYRIIFCGNIIAKDCSITRAINMADHAEVINIRNKNGKSVWPEKNSEADIAYILSKISYAASQREYFNNPISEGSVFKDICYKKLPKLQEYSILVCYTDPSFKDSKRNDFKATVLVGRWKDEFHIIRAFVEQTTTRQMVDWHYQVMDMIGDQQACYFFMESNFIQDIIMLEFQKAGQEKGRVVPLTGDDRKKPDKFTRIESLLEPLNTHQKLWFNESEKTNPHMQRLIEQFRVFEPGSSAHDDGPDAVEGAVYLINNKLALKGGYRIGEKRINPKRY